MRHFFVAVIFAVMLSPSADAQTRRIAAASHSGAATSRDADNFGLSMEAVHRYRAARDSTRRADSLVNDSVNRRIRPKQRR